MPDGPKQHAIIKEAGPQLHARLWGWYLFAAAKMRRFLLFSYKNVLFFLAVTLKISISYVATDANMLAEAIFKLVSLPRGNVV